MTLDAVISVFAAFAFCYPLVMSYVFMEGALIYFFRYEYKKPGVKNIPKLATYPFVSVLVPCYNESRNIRDTINAANRSVYPNYEIIAIDDGSKDDTLEILKEIKKTTPRLRIVSHATNQGKAVALKTGALASKGEFVVCIDGDSLIDPHAITWFMSHFLSSSRVGAVTGNPRVRTRSSILGRIQVGEFSAIIGLLKRAQRIYGRVFTVSGVISAFRKIALSDVGYWHNNAQAEDIDISWNLQLKRWDARYEPRCVCWVLMPETLRGLVMQRFRWAMGGAETFKRYTKFIFQWKSRRMWSVYIEYLISVMWAYTILVMITLWIIRFILNGMRLENLFTLYNTPAVVLGLTCLVQFLVSMIIDRRYDRKLMRNYFSIVWYPLVYWMMNCVLSIVAFPKVLFTKESEKRGRWISPDRGIHVTHDE